MTKWLGQSISKSAAHVECSLSAVVHIYQLWSEEGSSQYVYMDI